MLGYYNYTVILTYISLIISVLGMHLALLGNIKFALICLLLSGICDAFDAMTSDRGYNKVISKEDALKQLVLGKNTKYDPDIVDKFVAFNN